MGIDEKFCGDQFWDLNQTWNNQIPDFSKCFQDVVFISTPTLIFSIIFLFSIWQLRRGPSLNPLPWTWLNISKMVLSLSLFIMSIVWCGVVIHSMTSGSSTSHSSLLSSCARIMLFISNIILMLRHRACGVTTSYMLSVFWLVYTICAVVLHRSAILTYFTLGLQSPSGVIFILEMSYYPLIYVHLFLTVFTDKRKFDSLQESKIIEDVSFFSFITFSWFNRTIYKSRKKILTVLDLEFISVRIVAKRVYSNFLKRWQIDKPEDYISSSLAMNLMKAFWMWIVGAVALNVLYVMALFVPPLLLDRLIKFVDNDFYAWRGIFYALLFFAVDMIGKLANDSAVFFFFCSGSQIKSALMNAVYRKNLLLSTDARKEYSSGVISNLLSVDIQRMTNFTYHCSSLITCPLRIVVVLIIMWQYIGIATLAGVAVLGLLLPITIFVSKISQKYTVEQMKIKDLRLKFMNEILSGIKILKLYAWELAFSEKVLDARRKELKMILNSKLCTVFTLFIFFCAPIMVSVASFATYLLVDRNNVFDPTKAFVTLTLMEQLKFAVFALPDTISELIQINISFGRLKKFLTAANTDSTVVGNRPDKGEVLTIRRASFSWTDNADYILTDIDLHIKKGELVAIIGPVGAGKSSLLSAILGELYKRSGSVDIRGSLAYVPQQAWILNQTVRDNILLMKNMMEGKYHKILDLSCLRPDLEILPGGDSTEIGEKGVNLSGGQKQRVSLARAVYQDKDIYLLDDTLSAVDAHVRKALFDDIIGNEGLLRKKTRILVTHDVSVLHKVDIIVSMKDGKIDEIGTYNDLINQNGSFMSFMQEHTSQRHLDENAEVNKKLLSRYISTDSAASKASEDSMGESFASKKTAGDKMYRLTEDEKMEIGKVNRTIYWNYMKKMSLPLSLFTVVGFVIYVTFETFANIWLSEWTSDPVVNGTQDIHLTTWRLEIYAATGFGQITFMIFGSTCLMFASIRAARMYHSQMLSSLIKSPMSFFDSTPMGRITNRFSSDLDVLDTVLVHMIEGFLNYFLYMLASFYIIGRRTPIFLATLLPIGIIYYILQKFYLHCLRQLRRLSSTTKSPIFSQLLESIQGVSSIRAYKVENDFIETFETKIDNHIVCYLATTACNRWLSVLLDMIGSIIVLTSTTLAVQNRHNLSPADVGLMIAYTLNVTDCIKWFVRITTELEDKSISVERVDEYCHLTPESPWRLQSDREYFDWPSTGNISFRNYSTKYRENLDLVLKEIDLSVTGGEKVGIVGRTGAGKSSITMALFRIIEPVTGTIFIDDADIKNIGLHTLRSKLTIIPQDPVLFTGSLRSNLDPQNEYTEEALWVSLEQSHLKTFVSSLDGGLEHDIEEGGANLSAGQKQLVCLARALLKKTKILVLDEATASVDMETDNLIQNTIRSAFSKNTVITIAHRLNTILDYDKVIVMENGTVYECGNPVTLMNDPSTRFHQLAKDAGLI